MEKRDALSVRPQAWCFIDEPEAGITAALQGAVEVVHRKTDVVNTGTPLGDVLADRGVVGLCFEELHQRFAGRQSHDGGTVGIVQGNLGQPEDITVEGKQLVEGTHGDPDMGDARAAAYGVGHGRLSRSGRERIPNSNPADGRKSNRSRPASAPMEHMMANAVEVNDGTFAAEIEQCAGLAVVDFWATWCAPCRMIAPMVEALATEYAGKVKVAKLDVDNNPKTSALFNVRSIPTILFFKDGKLIDQVVGAVPRPQLEAKFKEHA